MPARSFQIRFLGHLYYFDIIYSKANLAKIKVSLWIYRKPWYLRGVFEDEVSVFSSPFLRLQPAMIAIVSSLRLFSWLVFSPLAVFSRLAHYCQLRDVQTLAMLCSVFEAQSRPQGIPNPLGPFPSRSSNLVVSHSRYVSLWFSGLCLTFSKGKLPRGMVFWCCSCLFDSPVLPPLVPAPACQTQGSTLVDGT